MNNVRVNEVLEILELARDETEMVIVDINCNNETTSKIKIYSQNNDSDGVLRFNEKTVDFGKSLSLINNFCGFRLNYREGKLFDRDSHRKIISISMVIPDAILLIDYEDCSESVDIEDKISEYFRNNFCVINPH